MADNIEWVVFCKECGEIDKAPNGPMIEAKAKRHKIENVDHTVILGTYMENTRGSKLVQDIKKIAYIIIDDQKNEKGEYIPCVVKEGVPGFFITDWGWGHDKQTAEKIAEEYNKKMGISKEAAITLTLKSMRCRHET